MGIYLGIDVGTSGTKALAINDRGDILADITSAEYPLYHPQPSWSEQNPEDWWQASTATIRAVVERAVAQKAGAKAADVKAIGLSGQMHGSVFLDERQRVIRP